METKIASYQEPGIRVQLVRIEKKDIGTDEIPTTITKIKYQIRVNRKILWTVSDKYTAIRILSTEIHKHLMQTQFDI